jgi:hypothetical protein
MTNKNVSVNPLRIRIEQLKPDSANPKAAPAMYEVGTLDNGVVIVKQVIVPPKAGVLPATERRAE